MNLDESSMVEPRSGCPHRSDLPLVASRAEAFGDREERREQKGKLGRSEMGEIAPLLVMVEKLAASKTRRCRQGC